MKLFFISDIHGNQFALEAILTKALSIKSDRIFCLGDISGYFTGINEVIQLLQANKVVSIKGNHDAFLTKSLIINKNKAYYPAYLKTKSNIGLNEFNWLCQLDDYAKIQIDNCIFEMYHGGANDFFNEYVFPNQIGFDKYKNHSTNIFLFGHTHLQFAIKYNGKTYANPGAVGLPRNGDFRAHGLLYDTQENLIKEYKVPYDLNKFNEIYFGDASVNNSYLHNINFGRSSSKPLISSNKPFLDEETLLNLEYNGISIINTKYGMVISCTNNLFLDNLIYVASYADSSVEISSNTLIFNWEMELYKKPMHDIPKTADIKKDMAGLYYYRFFPCAEDFKTNILSIINNAIEEINKIKTDYV